MGGVTLVLARRRTKTERNEEYIGLESTIKSISSRVNHLTSAIYFIPASEQQVNPTDDVKYGNDMEMESMTSDATQERPIMKRAVNEILIAADEGILSGIHGITVELCDLNLNPYKQAILPLFRHDMETIIVEDRSAALAAIEFLKEFKFGQAKFFPITTRELRPWTAVRSLMEQPGAIDLAVNLLEFEDKYRPVFSVICRNAVVVEDLEFAKRYNDRQIFMVTLQGDMILPNGTIKAGSVLD